MPLPFASAGSLRPATLVFVAALFLVLSGPLSAWSRKQTLPQPVPARDPAVQGVVDGVQKARLEKTVRALAAFPTRHTLSGAAGVDAAADYLVREFEAISQASGGRLRVERDTWTQPAGNRMPAPHVLTNVLATLPGTETPERVIVVSGHYDSRVTDVMDAASLAPGANDDASGVAVVMELARLMAGHRYACTVVFAAVTGEEQGLYGSSHLAEAMTAAKRNIVAMITNDIVGNSQGEGRAREGRQVRLFSAGYAPSETPAQALRRQAAGTDADTPARTLARAAADSARRYVRGFTVVLVYRNDRYGRGGDHTPFLRRGYAAVRLTEPNEDWRHQHQDVRTQNGVRYGDLPEFVDYAYLARVAQVNAATVAELASAPASPIEPTLKPDLSPQTTLSWTVPDGAAACEVLWRRTTDADWKGTRLLPPAQTTVILPLSKDDYLFAVRAVGARGARGLPAIPTAGRVSTR
ncbi:MAG: M28 family peptidase [Cytophagales bacterium]|nr:M28 family peptidase [Armatimonadota bacterium]